MTRAAIIRRAGPGLSVQDRGRTGFLAQGLSRGGAMDLLALAEGAALLDQPDTCAALEIAGSFVTVEVTSGTRIALTGAPMRALVGDTKLAWNTGHTLVAGTKLDLSGAAGGYSYLHFGGGIATTPILGGLSTHLAAGIGTPVQAGKQLALGADRAGPTGLTLTPQARFDGGTLRMVESPQTSMFSTADRARFCATVFRKDLRANRMGQRLLPDGPGFPVAAGLSILSDVIVPGDIQITGDGTPFVLLAECQTTGGYPRIGSVLPCDLPRLVQAPAGAALRFQFVTLDHAVELELAEATRRETLRRTLRPLLRDPRALTDLLAYQLISGVTCGDDLERERR
jgi:5-oxoprolinase (ATP-hydrolysing) subunit C